MRSLLKHFFIASLLGLIGFSTYLSLYLGVFKSVTVELIEKPSFFLLALEHIGPYHLISPRITQVEDWAKSRGITCRNSFGLYRDNPNEVAHERLTSWGGCVLLPVEAQALMDSSHLPEGFILIHWQAERALRASFGGAPSISPYKVYPALRKHAAEQRLELETSVLEIYPSSERFSSEHRPNWISEFLIKIKTSAV
jgi:hypothetical protein